MKLGSLFDSIGGFPLAATRHGITPVWTSEIDQACVSITQRHFPDMAHLGDICGINGAVIEPVDVITFGSPCQDLSVAGQRAGLQGARSGLFGEAIRIIKEMREATHGRYPAWAVWENVPGAFSSNNGLDFKAVLESFAKAAVPMPESGRWANAGMVRSGNCDIAWRVLDAQYWGVPQRRRRIFLVANFGGRRAVEVLFNPEGLRGNYPTGGTPGQATAGNAGAGAAGTNFTVRMRSGCDGGGKGPLISQDRSLTLKAHNDQALFAQTYDARGYGNGATANMLTGDHQGRITDYTVLAVYPEVARTLAARHNSSPCTDRGQNVVVTGAFMAGQGEKAGSIAYQEEIAPTLKASPSGLNQALSICIGIDSEFNANNEMLGTLRAHCSGGAEHFLCVSTGQAGAEIIENTSPTLNCNHEQPYIAGSYQQVAGTLSPGAHPGSYNGQDASNDMLVASWLYRSQAYAG